MGKVKPQKGCTRVAINDRDKHHIIGEASRQVARQYMCRLALKVFYSPKLDNWCSKVQMSCDLGDVWGLLPLS